MGEQSAGSAERFDLVVGADGLRSTVRRLAFGPDADYLRPFHHIIGATILKEPVPGFGPLDGMVLAEPGRSVVPQTRRDKTTRTLTQTLLGNATGKRLMQRVLAPQFQEKSLDVAA